MAEDRRDWRPRAGNQVRCVEGGSYFVKGHTYTVARGRKGKMVGFYVYEPLGFAVLTHIDSFEPVGARRKHVSGRRNS